MEGCSNVLVADGLIDQDESQFVLYHLQIEFNTWMYPISAILGI
jgi:hypothetical protein